tara:strand:+ start:1768 stop:1941 length:174 start_codon:yes stop_codon:yes gene_type:complete
MAARKKKKASSKGRPAAVNLGKAKKGSIKGRKTVKARGNTRTRKITRTSKSAKRSYR